MSYVENITGENLLCEAQTVGRICPLKEDFCRWSEVYKEVKTNLVFLICLAPTPSTPSQNYLSH